MSDLEGLAAGSDGSPPRRPRASRRAKRGAKRLDVPEQGGNTGGGGYEQGPCCHLCVMALRDGPVNMFKKLQFHAERHNGVRSETEVEDKLPETSASHQAIAYLWVWSPFVVSWGKELPAQVWTAIVAFNKVAMDRQRGHVIWQEPAAAFSAFAEMIQA